MAVAAVERDVHRLAARRLLAQRDVHRLRRHFVLARNVGAHPRRRLLARRRQERAVRGRSSDGFTDADTGRGIRAIASRCACWPCQGGQRRRRRHAAGSVGQRRTARHAELVGIAVGGPRGSRRTEWRSVPIGEPRCDFQVERRCCSFSDFPRGRFRQAENCPGGRKVHAWQTKFTLEFEMADECLICLTELDAPTPLPCGHAPPTVCARALCRSSPRENVEIPPPVMPTCCAEHRCTTTTSTLPSANPQNRHPRDLRRARGRARRCAR